MSALIESLIRAGLHEQPLPPATPPFRLVTFRGDGLLPGVELDRAARTIEEDDAALSLDKAGR